MEKIDSAAEEDTDLRCAPGASSVMDDKFGEDNHNSDKYRMWAAVSFAVMLLVVGVPLWWKTTEVERSTLPYSAIAELEPSLLTISTTLFISTEYPTLYNTLRSAFLRHFKQNSSVLKVDIVSLKIDDFLKSSENVSLDSVEAAASAGKIVNEAGSLLLMQLPSIEGMLVSHHRIIYFSESSKVEDLVECVVGWILEEAELGNKRQSMLDPQAPMEQGDDTITRLKAATSYDFVFTIVNSDPSRTNISFDIKHLIKRYAEPLLMQLDEIAKHRARSQWIHLLDLSSYANRDAADGVLVITSDSLPHIITPLEKRIGSGVCGVAGCVQLVLYVNPCHASPLVFGAGRSLSMTAPPWGAVQILNPDPELCSNGSMFSPKSTPIMATFISQIHSLLGFTNPPGILHSRIRLLRKLGPELRLWQLDSLFRMRALEQLVSASLTLKSLAKLLGEISNIVINPEVARCVEVSVASVEQGLKELRGARLVEALRSSQTAFVHAEKAFTDPSLLALLYFPDDQKYAVYIPLFLPIMIPVFMSLKPIYKWLIGSSQTSVQ